MSTREELQNLIAFIGLEELHEKYPLIEEDDVFGLLCAIKSTRYLNPRNSNFKSLDWWMSIMNSNDDNVFRNQFRMTSDSFFKLATLIKDHPSINELQDPVPLQLAVALYRFGTFGNASGAKQVAIKFSISVGSVLKFTDRIIEALTCLSEKWIRWPSKSERVSIGNNMAAKLLPKCVGFIDGTDVVLTDAPLENKDAYFSRKKKYAMQVQVVCDPTKLIRDLFVGYPGSVHDAKVYSTSPIGVHRGKFFSDGEFIVGDSAYPLGPTLITPYRNKSSGLEREKRQFNYHLSGQRVAVEHTIGLLKSRFQSLKGMRIRVDHKTGHKKVCKWIHACAILHNMLTEKDPWTLDNVELNNQPNYANECEQNSKEGSMKREALFELFKAFRTTHH